MTEVLYTFAGIAGTLALVDTLLICAARVLVLRLRHMLRTGEVAPPPRPLLCCSQLWVRLKLQLQSDSRWRSPEPPVPLTPDAV